MDYKQLTVWQKAIKLAVEIYKITNNFTKSELYGLCSQMRRASVSISSNIAEGSRRKTSKDKNHFLTIAFGSATELESQICIAKKLNFVKTEDCKIVDSLLTEVLKMLNKMTSYY